MLVMLCAAPSAIGLPCDCWGQRKGRPAPSFTSHCAYSFGGESPIRVSTILFSVCSNKSVRQSIPFQQKAFDHVPLQQSLCSLLQFCCAQVRLPSRIL